LTAESIARDILRRRGSSHLLLLCDFDGTLSDFDPDPTAVYLSDARRDVLARLAARPCCTVGIVSGRRLADVRARAGDIGDVYLAGFHGLEIEGLQESFVHPDATSAAAALDDVRRRVGPSLRRLPAVFIVD
jgi:trehalose 6-phosphate phosphatase